MRESIAVDPVAEAKEAIKLLVGDSSLTVSEKAARLEGMALDGDLVRRRTLGPLCRLIVHRSRTVLALGVGRRPA